MKKFKYWMAAIGILILFALLMIFWPAASDKVGAMVGKTGDAVRDIARTVAGAAIGLALISWGVAAIGVPIVGIPMIIAGAALVAYALWPLFSGSSTPPAKL